MVPPGFAKQKLQILTGWEHPEGGVTGKEGMAELVCSSLEHLGQEQLGQKDLEQGHSELGFKTRVFAIEQLHLKLIVTDPFCPDESLDPFSEFTDSIEINLL